MWLKWPFVYSSWIRHNSSQPKQLACTWWVSKLQAFLGAHFRTRRNALGLWDCRGLCTRVSWPHRDHKGWNYPEGYRKTNALVNYCSRFAAWSLSKRNRCGYLCKISLSSAFLLFYFPVLRVQKVIFYLNCDWLHSAKARWHIIVILLCMNWGLSERIDLLSSWEKKEPGGNVALVGGISYFVVVIQRCRAELLTKRSLKVGASKISALAQCPPGILAGWNAEQAPGWIYKGKYLDKEI